MSLQLEKNTEKRKIIEISSSPTPSGEDEQQEENDDKNGKKGRKPGQKRRAVKSTTMQLIIM